ncbi:hypothetical protein AU195_01315 [Mycobacterium sp. IS-1496]|uniref:hypothetical protein n=1 Tax=Mycobacterium sp. IS-1496 TaxID=1772284 RepID=UPI0007416AD8|nr:hypothetical protein [Mycobacterium sp. IS-1496]KUI24459.1 hypothetical protein AU195_01315 [Mycobacterium sp. IS-1496]
MSTSNEHLSEESQEQRGAPGSRDTGSDTPSGGPADRPSGTLRGDETVPAYAEEGRPGQTGGEKTEAAPSDAKPAVPPYEGRQETAKPDTGTDGGDARTGGAVKPGTDTEYKDPSPHATPGGATSSPADEQPAAGMPESDRDDDAVGPAHSTGTGRGEDKI